MDLYLHYSGDPLKGSRWEDLSFEDYLNMSNEERQELKSYLEDLIEVPPGWGFVDEDGYYNEWMHIVSLSSDEELKDYYYQKKISEKISSLSETKELLSKDDLIGENDLGDIPEEMWLQYVNNDGHYYNGYLLPF